MTNIVEQVLEKLGETQSSFARRLATITGKKVTRQAVFQWIKRDQFPRSMCGAVSDMTDIPLRELLDHHQDDA